MVIITPISDKKKSTVPEPDTVLFGGDYRDRPGDLLHAMQALSQLSYTPERSAILRDIFDLVNSIPENRILKSKN